MTTPVPIRPVELAVPLALVIQGIAIFFLGLSAWRKKWYPKKGNE